MCNCVVPNGLNSAKDCILCYNGPVQKEDEMTKHILDRSRPPTNKRLQKVLNVDRALGPRRPTIALQRRQRARTQTVRMAQFLRIARQMQG